MRRRVVITGMGCINPMGNDVETMWTQLKGRIPRGCGLSTCMMVIGPPIYSVLESTEVIIPHIARSVKAVKSVLGII